MAIQEVTSVGWFGRIGSSLKGILVGLVLGVVAVAVLVLNERNAIRDIRANREIAREVVSVGSDTVNPGNEGKLVHLNGPVATDDILRNEQFGIEENAIRLGWAARIYQWVEDERSETREKLGGGQETITTYSYRKEWVDAPVDSSGFKEGGHQNTGKQEFESGSDEARNVTLGAFRLPQPLIAQIRSSEPYALQKLPPPLAAKGTLAAGVFHTGDPGAPRIGDEKVGFSITRPGDASVMAVQAKDSFAPYKTRNGKTKFLLYEGLLSAEEVVEGEEKKAMMLRWILRGAGFLAMFLGFGLILKPLSVLADVVPIFGSLVGWATGAIAFLLAAGISFVIIAISWVFFRPLVGIPLLVFGLGCLFLVIVKVVKGRRAATGGTAPAAAG